MDTSELPVSIERKLYTKAELFYELQKQGLNMGKKTFLKQLKHKVLGYRPGSPTAREYNCRHNLRWREIRVILDYYFGDSEGGEEQAMGRLSS